MILMIVILGLAVNGKIYPATTADRSVVHPKASSAPRIVVTPKATPSPTVTPRPTPSLVPTPSPTPRPTAGMGDRGDAVKQIQQRLADLGYLKGSIDGIYGNQTAGAVKVFQNAIGVEATGIVDASTSRSLFFTFAKAAVTPITTNTPKPTAKVKEANAFPEYRDSASKGTKYVLNKNTKKFHKPSCRHVKKIKPKNYKEYTGTRDEVINMGYVPCKVCSP